VFLLSCAQCFLSLLFPLSASLSLFAQARLAKFTNDGLVTFDLGGTIYRATFGFPTSVGTTPSPNTGSSLVPAEAVAFGIQARYNFENTSNVGFDSSLNGRSGRLVGNVKVTTNSRIGAVALQLDQQYDQYVEIPTMPFQPLETFAAWIRVQASTPTMGLYSRSNADGDEIHLTLVNGVPHLQLSTAAKSYILQPPSPDLRDNRWHHVAYVLEPTRATIYVDFTPTIIVRSQHLFEVMATITRPFTSAVLGARRTAGSLRNQDAYFIGLLDDIQIFNRSLSADALLLVGKQDAHSLSSVVWRAARLLFGLLGCCC
jgi:hypothetical protein